MYGEVLDKSHYWAHCHTCGPQEYVNSYPERVHFTLFDAEADLRGSRMAVHRHISKAEVNLRVVLRGGRDSKFPRPEEAKKAGSGCRP